MIDNQTTAISSRGLLGRLIMQLRSGRKIQPPRLAALLAAESGVRVTVSDISNFEHWVCPPMPVLVALAKLTRFPLGELLETAERSGWRFRQTAAGEPYRSDPE